MDSLFKALELAAKYAWTALLVTALVLFAPDRMIAELHLLQFRTMNEPYLWLIFLFTGILAISNYMKPVGLAVWRFVLCPIKKIYFPTIDLRSRIKQSRIRYFLIQFSYRNGNKHLAYEAVDSNGTGCGFFDQSGRRMLPDEPNDGHVRLHDGKFQHPTWGRLDWRDIFTGDVNSGCWGIAER